MLESVDTVVVGGGQAGLSMSHYLSQSGREHVVLERGRVAERWHSERWESLAFQFPNAMLRLPGQVYRGDEPGSFMGARVSLVSSLTMPFGLLPLSGAEFNVTSLRSTDEGRFLLQAGQTLMKATNVVIATGPYQLPSIPSCSASLPLSVHQVTANRYTRPSDFPLGNVLVGGSGGSGCQIAEDLREGGRKVFYSIRRHRRMPRRYRGRDSAGGSRRAA